MRTVVALVLALALTACSQPHPGLPSTVAPTAGQDAYTIDLPPEFELIKGDVRLDFRIDQVRSGGVTYVGVYVGNYSSFSSREPGEGLITPGHPQTFTKSGSTVPSEWLWKTAYDFPAELHIWVVSGLTAEQSDVAHKIALSLRPTKPGGVPQ